MKTYMPESTSLAIRNLLQVASADGVTVAGFAFCSEPVAVTSFGNCSDHGSIELYTLLCRMADEKERQGLVIIDNVEKPV